MIRLILLTLSLLSLSDLALAAGLRHAALFTETLEGARRPASAVEGALIRELVAKGTVFVDETQSRRIRSVSDAGRLLEGQPVPDVITTLDADVLIVGVVELVRVQSTLLNPKVHRIDALVKLRTIAVDTGVVLASIESRGEGMGYSPEAAGDAAAGAAAKGLAVQILAAQSDRLELVIEDIPNVSTGDQILGRIRAIGEVKRAAMMHAGVGMSKIEVETSLGPRDLAMTLDSADLGMTVTGYSTHSIRARYDVARPGRLTLIVPPVQLRGSAPAWVRRTLGEVVASPLLSSGLFERGEELGSDRSKSAVLKISCRGAKDANLVVVDAKLIAAGSGALIGSVHDRCATADLGRCAGELGERLTERLTRQLGGPQRTGRPQGPLVISKLEFNSILPAQTGRAVGVIALRNTGTNEIEDVLVALRVRGYADVPVSIPVGTVAAGATVEAQLNVVFSTEAIIAHDEDSAAVASVEVEYADGAFRARMERNAAVVVHGRHAMSWKTPDSIASFVTARNDSIVGLAKELHAAIPEGARGDPLSLPVALFRGLGRLGLEYAPDPSSPFGKATLDYVMFPVETLRAKSGDCDDLAVVYAALAEAVGRRAMIVSIPGHVFVAVATGIPAQNSYRLAIDHDLMIAHHGQLFVPLETTKLGGTFHEAWHAAGATLGKWRARKDQIGLIEIQEAWNRFPATDLAAPGPAIPRQDLASLRTSIAEELDRIEAERRASLDEALEDSSKSPLEKATLLAQLEQYGEAKALLENLVRKKKTDFAALNNLGNVMMMMREPQLARARYRAALPHAPKSYHVRLRLNAAISAFVLGDEDDFADQIVLCMDNGGEEEVMQLARGGISLGENSRGAAPGQMTALDLDAALSRALARRKRALEPRLDRASDASETQSVGSYLHWLDRQGAR